MPLDRNNVELKEGDKILLQAKITHIEATSGLCTIELLIPEKTVSTEGLEIETPTTIPSINAYQLRRANANYDDSST